MEDGISSSELITREASRTWWERLQAKASPGPVGLINLL
jgi:hypothetical protein